jgi:hypothetical protein
MALADRGGKLLAMRIGTHQATKVRAEPAANARDEETHRGGGRRPRLRPGALRAQNKGTDREAGHEDSYPKKEGNHRDYVVSERSRGEQPVTLTMAR